VEQVFSPLDEKLELQPGGLTPLQLSYLVHFASLGSFERAAQLLMQHHGVYVSASTSRRQTEAIGAVAELVQDEQAKDHDSSKKDVSSDDAMALSSDGSLISLRGGVYAEVKTAVVGEIDENGCRSKQRPDQEVKMTHLSYFSRMAPAEVFTTLATGEIARRGFLRMKRVCAISDGAEWIQHFIDAQRAEAVRILDFYHAAEYISDIAALVRNAGASLPASWLDEQLHELKHKGPKKVLEEVNRLLQDYPDIENIDKKVNYLQKRQEMMQYPVFRAQGWPIGSGSAESANTCVVQARLKGPGMHWEPRYVNPMLALRTGICNNRWYETRDQAFHRRLLIRREKRSARQRDRYDKVYHNVQRIILRFMLLSPLLKVHKEKVSISSSQTEPVPARSISPPGTRVPSSNHPWRRFAGAKK